METLATVVFLTDVGSYRLEPMCSIWFEESRIIDDNLENKDFDVDVGLRSAHLLVQGLHKQGHDLCVGLPSASLEQLDHFLDASLDVSHAFVLVDIVHFELILGLLVLLREWSLFFLHFLVIRLFLYQMLQLYLL